MEEKLSSIGFLLLGRPLMQGTKMISKNREEM